MADYAFNEALYPDVRAVVGLDVDVALIPDDTLALPVYKGEAERFIMRNLTSTQYEDAAYSDEADYAAVLYLAALIVPTLRVVVSERIAGGNLTYANVNLESIATRLLERANARIADIQRALPDDSPVVSDNPNFFMVGSKRWPA